MRRVLLVEGSDRRPPRAEALALSQLWGTICDSLKVPRFDLVAPISKGLIEHLEEGEGTLDEEIERLGLGQPGDALVVAWDVRPVWARLTTVVCRWRETVGLYEQLHQRQQLPASLCAHVKARWQDLSGRSTPSEKTSPEGRLSAGSLYAVCMDPMFEEIFCMEDVIWQALELTGQRVKDWPPSWNKRAKLDAKMLLDKAIHAARRHKPQPAVVRRIGLDYTTNQEAWAAHFVRSFADHSPDKFGKQPVIQRLRTLLASEPQPPKEAARRK